MIVTPFHKGGDGKNVGIVKRRMGEGESVGMRIALRVNPTGLRTEPAWAARVTVVMANWFSESTPGHAPFRSQSSKLCQ